MLILVLPSKIIGLAVLWDEKVGEPRIVSETPPMSLTDRNSAATEIYIATASLFGQDDNLSCVVTELPFHSISPDHIAKVAFESWVEKSESGENINLFGYIAFIMDKNTALKLESFLSLAIQCFLNDFTGRSGVFNIYV